MVPLLRAVNEDLLTDFLSSSSRMNESPQNPMVEPSSEIAILDPPERHSIEKLPIGIEIHESESSVSAPPTPEPSPVGLAPIPLRYPDTLGTLIEVRESEGKGYGVFALHDILPGTVLLCEAPLVTLIDTGTRADPLEAAVDALSPEKKKSYQSLHSFTRNPSESLNRSILYSNGYSVMNDLATGIFETASRINHSCVPNSHYVWKERSRRMVFWNRFKLLAGEEVTVDYGHKKKYLARIYGFECACGGCTDSGSSGARSRSRSSSGGSQRGAVEDVPSIDAVIHDGVVWEAEMQS